MFGSLKSLINKPKPGGKIGAPPLAATRGDATPTPVPLVPVAPALPKTTTLAKPPTAPSTSTLASPPPNLDDQRALAYAPLGELLKGRLIFIDECLLRFVAEISEFASKSDISRHPAGRGHLTACSVPAMPLLLVPAEEEAKALAAVYVKAMRQLENEKKKEKQAQEEQPSLKKLRSDTTRAASASSSSSLESNINIDDEEQRTAAKSDVVKGGNIIDSEEDSTSLHSKVGNGAAEALEALIKACILYSEKGEEASKNPEHADGGAEVGVTAKSSRRRSSSRTRGSSAENTTSSNISDSVQLLIKDLLKSLYSFDAVVDKAVDAESDCKTLNEAATKLGESDAVVARAVTLATKKLIEELRRKNVAKEGEGGERTAEGEEGVATKIDSAASSRSFVSPFSLSSGFEVTNEWETNIPSIVLKLMMLCSLGGGSDREDLTPETTGVVHAAAAAATQSFNEDGDGVAVGLHRMASTVNDGESEIIEEESVLSQLLQGKHPKYPQPNAQLLVVAANVYTLLLLIAERETILREVVAYQHRWVVDEGRRIAERLEAIARRNDEDYNPFLPTSTGGNKGAGGGASDGAHAKSSAYVKGLRTAVLEANKAVRGALLADHKRNEEQTFFDETKMHYTYSAVTASSAVKQLYDVVFAVPFAATSSRNGQPVPHMLLGEVRAPSAKGASEYVLEKVGAVVDVKCDANKEEGKSKMQQGTESEEAIMVMTDPRVKLFTAAAVYHPCVIASRGDLRVRLQTLVDSLEGYGVILEAMQRDALLIRELLLSPASSASDGDTLVVKDENGRMAKKETSNRFTVDIPLAVTPSSSSSSSTPQTQRQLSASERSQLQKLLDGAESTSMPEKLRTVVVSIGVRLAYSLISALNSAETINYLAHEIAVATAEFPDESDDDEMEEDASEGMLHHDTAKNARAQAEKRLRPHLDKRLVTYRSGILNRSLKTEEVYFSYTIGTERWAMGIVGDSLHMRRSLEKIQNVRIAHVMNNAIVQSAMIGLKGLITFVGSRCKLEARLK